MQSLTDFAKTLAGLIREALGIVRQTFTLGLLSLALAVVIWFVVTDAQSPQKTGFFAGMIPVQAENLPQGLTPTSPSEIGQVKVRITADEDVWDGLAIADFEAMVDLSGVTQTRANVPVQVSVLRDDVKLVEVTPASIDVTLEPITTKAVPIKVSVVAPAPVGFDISDREVSPDVVQVSGAKSLVDQTEAACVDLNLTGVQVSLEREVVLAGCDKDSRPVDVHVEPATAKVNVTIVRTESELTFPVNPSLSGNVAAGYRTSTVEVDPPFVKVRGPLDVLQSISVLTTDTIPVDGAESDVVRSVKLSVPSGATVDGSNEVVVRVRVVPAQGQRNLQIAVQTRGLKEGLVAVLSKDQVTVTVAGPLPVLDTLPGDAVAAKIDLSGLDPGTYQLAPQIELPADVQMIAIDPANVVAILSPQ